VERDRGMAIAYVAGFRDPAFVDCSDGSMRLASSGTRSSTATRLRPRSRSSPCSSAASATCSGSQAPSKAARTADAESKDLSGGGHPEWVGRG
jgi:hypothetical protein